jgi:Transposase
MGMVFPFLKIMGDALVTGPPSRLGSNGRWPCSLQPGSYAHAESGRVRNYFDARQTSAAVEGINNKARVITKRTYGLKSAQSLWNRLILDLNRASEAIGWSIEQIRQLAKRLKVQFDWSCT